VLPCHYDPHWLNNIIYPYLNPWRFIFFSTDCVSGVKNLNTCVLDFCTCIVSVVWSVWVHGSFYGL
jgi:hypothetical protein